LLGGIINILFLSVDGHDFFSFSTMILFFLCVL